MIINRECFGLESITETIDLYHYSTDQYTVLKTMRLAGVVDREREQKFDKSVVERSLVGHYFDHISFFIDPIPLDLASLSGHRHTLWTKGLKLYEHKVTISINDVFRYDLVATPKHLKLLDDTLDGVDWDDERARKGYFDAERKISKDNGYSHGDYNTFITTISKFKNGTRQSFIDMFKLDLDMEYRQHAARVPHLMLYPENGSIPVTSVKRITLR